MKNSSQFNQKHCPLTLEGAMDHELKHGRLSNNPNVDLKKMRRVISNRLSAQRCRMRMENYTRDSEKTVKDLKDLLSTLAIQMKCKKEEKMLLELEYYSLQQEFEKRWNKSKRLELAIEAERCEIRLLKEAKNKLSSDLRGKEKATEYPIASMECEDDIDQYISFDALFGSGGD